MNKEKEVLVFASVKEYRARFSKEDASDWEEAGRPHCWVHVEKEGEYSVEVDMPYGAIRLLKNGREVRRGKWGIFMKKIVVLDKDYYGVHKYIWH